MLTVKEIEDYLSDYENYKANYDMLMKKNEIKEFGEFLDEEIEKRKGE